MLKSADSAARIFENGRLDGGRAERLAAAFLVSCGYRVLEMNYRRCRKEIDIVAREGSALCFVEVKARSTSGFGYGCEAVDARKQAAIRRTAACYLNEHRMNPLFTECRFDVVSVDAGRISLYRNAF